MPISTAGSFSPPPSITIAGTFSRPISPTCTLASVYHIGRRRAVGGVRHHALALTHIDSACAQPDPS